MGYLIQRLDLVFSVRGGVRGGGIFLSKVLDWNVAQGVWPEESTKANVTKK